MKQIAAILAVLCLLLTSAANSQSFSSTVPEPEKAVSAQPAAPAVEEPVKPAAPAVPDELRQEMEQLVAEMKKLIEEQKLTMQKPQPAPAAAPFQLTGQLRHRTELDGRSFVPDARTLGYSLLRSRINLSVAPTSDTKLFLQLQDSRLFGAGNAAMNRGTQDGMSKSIDFHQAYFAVDRLFGSPVNIKVGRQELSYGRQRLLSVSNWNNIGNTFDAAVIQVNSESFSVDAFAAKLIGSQTTTNSENLTGVYGVFRYLPAHSADVHLLMDNNTNPLPKGSDKGSPRLARFSNGISFFGKVLPFDYDAEVVLQKGTLAVNDSAALSDISAYLLSFHAGYTVDPASKLRIAMKYQVMSGDADQRSGPYTTYNTLFSSAHSFFGFMDYFPKTVPEYGIRAFSLHAGMNILSGTGLTADLYRYRFDADASLKNAAGTTVKAVNVGYEADLTLTHKYSPAVSVTAGVSAFTPDQSFRLLKGSSVSYWTFVMTTVNF